MIATLMDAAYAALPDTLPLDELRLRLQVVQEVLTWQGTPYHHQGRIHGAGVDCGTLLIETYEAVGVIPKMATPEYPHDWHLHRSEEKYLGHVARFCRRVEVPLPGDLALFRYGRCISHGAVIIAAPTFIHATMDLGVVEDDWTRNLEMGKRLAGFWSFWPRGEA